MAFLLIIIAIVEAAACLGVIYFFLSKNTAGIKQELAKVEQEVTHRESLHTQLKDLMAQMIDVGLLREQGKELISAKEALKAERGRNTITQAELETVESRLRELEEIERELEASGIETKEELKILKKKEKELSSKNEQLKQQIETSLKQMEELFAEIELTAQVQEQITAMKTELVTTQSKIDLLLLQIEQSNEQYFLNKQRYDALDIEYAQLYEKFSASEG
jgi:chromosome segregation ATPase